MRSKLAGAIAFGIFAVTICIAFKISSLGKRSNLELLSDNVQSEAGLTKASAQWLIRAYAEELTSLASLEESLKENPQPGLVNTVFLKSELLAAALLEPAKSGWRLRWVKQKNKKSSLWSSANSEKMIRSLPLAAVQSDNVIWFRHLSKSGHALYSFLVRLNSRNGRGARAGGPFIAVGVLSNQAFSSLIENFKSTTREVMILDEQGHALGYTSQQYVGAPMKTHPMVGSLLKERKILSVGEYKNRSQQAIVGAYEKLDNSNLYVAVAQSTGSLPQLVSSQILSLLGFSVGGFLLATVFAFYLIRPTIAAYEYLQDLAIALGQGLPIRQPAHYAEFPPVLLQSIENLKSEGPPKGAVVSEGSMVSPKSNADILEKEKSTIYRQVASGLVSALNGPIHVILGQSQLARSKADQTDQSDHVIAIEREARAARKTLENLMRVSGDADDKRIRVKPNEIILLTVKSLKNELQKMGVIVKNEISPIGQVLVNPEKLQLAFTEIIKNAIESMVESDSKELLLSSKNKGSLLTLLIQDSGSGVDNPNLAKVFSPFFTTKEPEDHKGLGLSMAKGIVESLGGKIKIESSAQEGTQVAIELPIASAEEETMEAKSSVIPWESDPNSKTADLSGHLPITGSEADNLPTLPSHEEDSDLSLLLDDETEEDFLESVSDSKDSIPEEIVASQEFEVAAQQPEDLDSEEISAVESASQLKQESNSADTDTDFVVSIRKPKVGGS